MTPVLAHEGKLYFEQGGPIYRLMQPIGMMGGRRWAPCSWPCSLAR
jgi:hypothetical protein